MAPPQASVAPARPAPLTCGLCRRHSFIFALPSLRGSEFFFSGDIPPLSGSTHLSSSGQSPRGVFTRAPALSNLDWALAILCDPPPSSPPCSAPFLRVSAFIFIAAFVWLFTTPASQPRSMPYESSQSNCAPSGFSWQAFSLRVACPSSPPAPSFYCRPLRLLVCAPVSCPVLPSPPGPRLLHSMSLPLAGAFPTTSRFLHQSPSLKFSHLVCLFFTLFSFWLLLPCLWSFPWLYSFNLPLLLFLCPPLGFWPRCLLFPSGRSHAPLPPPRRSLRPTCARHFSTSSSRFSRRPLAPFPISSLPHSHPRASLPPPPFLSLWLRRASGRLQAYCPSLLTLCIAFTRLALARRP